MPDLFELFSRWWRQIILLAIVSTVVAAVILFFTVNKYLGIATALPAPTYAADKTGVFSQNLQALYSTLGSTDDLDKFLGTARLDTIYLAVAEQFDLPTHYDIKREGPALRKSALKLKKMTRVVKTDYGE